MKKDPAIEYERSNKKKFYSHLLKDVDTYLGLFGIVIAFFVQLGILQPLITDILDTFLFARIIYAVNIPNIALNIENSIKGRLLISLSGVLFYAAVRYIKPISVFVLISLIGIAFFILAIWKVKKNINWSNPPIKLRKRYYNAYNVAEKESLHFVNKDTLFFWGFFRFGLFDIFIFRFTTFELFPYYVGLLFSGFFIGFFDEVVPISLILSLILLIFAIFRVKSKLFKQIRNSFVMFLNYPKSCLKAIRNPVKTIFKENETVEHDRVSSIVVSFIKPRAFFYFGILFWVSLFSYAMFILWGRVLYGLINASSITGQNYLIMLGCFITLLPTSIVPFYFSLSLFLSLRAGKKIQVPFHPHLLLACSSLSILIIHRTPQFTSFLQFILSSILHLPLSDFKGYVLSLVGLTQIFYLLWAISKKKLIVYEENMIAILLTIYILTLLFFASGEYGVIASFLIFSWLWYSCINFFRTVSFSDSENKMNKHNILSFALALFFFGVFSHYEISQSAMAISLLGALCACSFLLEEKQKDRLGWFLFGIKEIEKDEIHQTPWEILKRRLKF